MTSYPICGVCRLPLRGGQESRCIRLTPDDCRQMADLGEGGKLEPGLYSACPTCLDRGKQAIGQRTGKSPASLSRDDLV